MVNVPQAKNRINLGFIIKDMFIIMLRKCVSIPTNDHYIGNKENKLMTCKMSLNQLYEKIN